MITGSGCVRPRDGVWCDAVISNDGVYRYTLTRGFNGERPTNPLVLCMLNPSTADGLLDDPTIVRASGFARRGAFDGLHVVNLGAFRATDPAEMRRATDPVGPRNDEAISQASLFGGLLVVAWGANAERWPERVRRVTWLLPNRRLMCWGVTRSGHPKHPLYLPAATPLVGWSPT